MITKLSERMRRRALVRKAMQKVNRAEGRYRRDLREVMTVICQAYIRSVLSMAVHDHRLRQDATEYDDEINKVSLGIAAGLQRPMDAAFRRMAKTVVGAFTPFDIGLAAMVEAAREANLLLIENAGRHYAAEVREVFSRPDIWGMRVEQIRKLLLARAKISVRHADLIARDQTLKLNGAINKTRQVNAGVEEYTWSGVMDARERESHVKLEGAVLKWSEGAPSLGGLHPGDDYECRCIAIPVFD